MKEMSSLVSATASASRSVTIAGTPKTAVWFAESWDIMASSRSVSHTSLNSGVLSFFYFLQVTTKGRYGRVSDDFGADDVACKGNEDHLAECSYNTNDNCKGTEGAGVVCDSRSLAEIENERNLIASCFEDGVSYHYGEYIDIATVERSVV